MATIISPSSGGNPSPSPALPPIHTTKQISPSSVSKHAPRRRYQIQPGVWSDGALSTDLPLVQSCLEQARLLRRIPPTPCIVFVLAALHVYTSYTDVAHWLFWGPRFKHETAKTVDFVLNHRGVTIKSPVSWIGVSENLFIIGAQQAAWRTKLTLMDWYKTLVTPPPAERRILRKRKAAPVSFEFDDGADLDLPNKKRPRTKRVVKPKPSSSATSHDTGPSASRDLDAATVDLDDVQPDEDASTAVSSLGDQSSRARPGKQPKTREESILSSLSSLSTTSSVNHDQNTKADTRASSEASEGTAVSSSGGTLRRRRSFSGSSAGTAIGFPETKDGSVTMADTDEGDLKSSRPTKTNNKRGRGRPKNK